MTSAHPPPLIAHYHRTQLILMGAVSLLFVLGGLWMVGLLGEPPEARRLSPMLRIIFGYGAILFFGVLSLATLQKALTGGLALRIDETGLYYPRVSKTTMAWEDIESFRLTDVMGTKLVAFELREGHNVPIGPIARLSMSANKAMVGYSNSIATNGIDATAPEVAAAMKAFTASAASRLP